MPRKKKEVLDDIESRIAGAALLSDEDRAEVRKRAADHVRSARKEKAVDELFKLAVIEEEREYEPAQERVDFTVDLPDYAPFIKINNVMFFHGLTYEVPMGLARDMMHIQYRAWCHENEWRQGKSPHDMTRGPLNRTLSMHGVVNSTSTMRH